MEKLALSLSETAELLGVGKRLIRAAVGRGDLPSIKVGARYLVPRSALERILGGPIHLDRDGGPMDEPGKGKTLQQGQA